MGRRARRRKDLLRNEKEEHREKRRKCNAADFKLSRKTFLHICLQRIEHEAPTQVRNYFRLSTFCVINERGNSVEYFETSPMIDDGSD